MGNSFKTATDSRPSDNYLIIEKHPRDCEPTQLRAHLRHGGTCCALEAEFEPVYTPPRRWIISEYSRDRGFAPTLVFARIREIRAELGYRIQARFSLGAALSLEEDVRKGRMGVPVRKILKQEAAERATEELFSNNDEFFINALEE